MADTTPPRIRPEETSPVGAPPPIARVDVGMTVVDAAGEEAGTVAAVQQPGTQVRPDAVTPIAEQLMSAGYLRIDGSGALSNDTFAGGDQLADADGGTVRLRVSREKLHRAAP